MVRLTHLQMGWLWDSRPRVPEWFERIQARPSFKAGIGDWLNEKYLPLMAEKGSEAAEAARDGGLGTAPHPSRRPLSRRPPQDEEFFLTRSFLPPQAFSS